MKGFKVKVVSIPYKAKTYFLRYFSGVAFGLVLLHQTGTGTPAHGYEDGSGIGLTAKEKAWLEKHPVVRVGDSSEFEPELIKNTDGTYSGTLVDILRLLEERLGIRFEIVDDKWPEILRRAEKKEIDAIGMMNKALAEKMGLITIEAPLSCSCDGFRQ